MLERKHAFEVKMMPKKGCYLQKLQYEREMAGDVKID